MNKKRNVLICNELWCDGLPDKNRTNSEHNLIKTFDATQFNYNLHTLHIDEAVVVYKSHIDNVIVDYCKNYNIEIVIFSLIGGSSYNPSFSTYQKLKEMGIYICFMWPDATFDINNYGVADLHILWDRSDLVEDNPKILPLFVPQDQSQFYKQEQDIPISFVGSVDKYPDRQFFVSNLKQIFPEMTICGGQREDKLTPAQYSEIVRRSMIGLNFSMSRARFFQVKGRVYEILASGSMLLEFKNRHTANLLKPNVDYVEFGDLKELVEKTVYYLKNPKERETIAANGHKKYQNLYTAKIFWNTIFTRIEKELNDATNQSSNPVHSPA